MKKIAIALSALILISSNCKKDPPVIPEDLLVQLLTDGEWSVTEYKLNGVDRTTEFAGWRFKYYNNKSVEAKFNTVVQNTGTWDASQSTMNLTNNFPTATTPPVTLSTGTWHVDQPGTRIVVASQTSGSDVKNMKLYRE